LLAADGSAASEPFISGAVASAARALASGAERVGERVGAYQLVRELGHGGMGTVYLADRVDEQYRASVAIKLVRGPLSAPELARRLRAERQILASLIHPNIATLLDGGTAADGTPYLVMEYVDGESIEEWCDHKGLGLAERIAMFLRVCSAVQFAHQQLVVHQDIKPSNILVTADGIPKLLDFGIAKSLAPDSGPDATLTLRLMTPAYAAPEQVRGERVTVATDIYALGGVLYRLLAGRVPIDVSGASPIEMERRICEENPAAPSAAAAGPAVAWRRMLRGDLDTIILEALRKEPERRYASVEQLAGDLRRYEAGLPVIARPDTLRYRGAKFVRRHRAGLLLTTIIALLTTLYAVRLAHERDHARVEAEKAAQVSTFLQDMFRVADPGRSHGQEVTARELLDRGAEQVARELDDQPAVQSALMQVIGEVYERLGLYTQARDQFAKALDIRRRIYGGENDDVARSEAYLALSLDFSGDPAGAGKHYREALRITRLLHPGDNEQVISSLASLATYLRRSGEHLDESETLYREALSMRQRLGRNDVSLAQLSDGLASALQWRGDYAGAEPLFRKSLSLVRARQPVDSLVLDVAMHNLALDLVDLGKLDEAAELFRQSLGISIAYYGPNHPETSVTRVSLATVLRSQGALREAEEQYRLALAADSAALGSDHPQVGSDYGYLGTTLIRESKLNEAEAALKRALEIRRKALGPEHPFVAMSMNELAGLYLARDELGKADSLFRAALALRRRVYRAGHPYIAYSLVGLARTLMAEARGNEAAPLLDEARTIRAAALPEGHPLRHEVDSLRALIPDGSTTAAQAVRPLVESR
jgi:serine/threonine-protein kinase